MILMANVKRNASLNDSIADISVGGTSKARWRQKPLRKAKKAKKKQNEPSGISKLLWSVMDDLLWSFKVLFLFVSA